MNRLLISPIRPNASAATFALAALLTTTAYASEKAEFSAPTGKSASSLAPVKPSDEGFGLKNSFGSSQSQTPVVDLGHAGGSQTAPTLDAKTWAKVRDIWDRKRNWILNDDRNQAGTGNEKEKDPFDEARGHHRTVLEKRIMEDDPTKAKRSGNRSDKVDYVWSDPASDRARQLHPDASSASATIISGPDRDGPDGTRANFSSPFDAAKAESLSGDRDASAATTGDRRDFRAGSLADSAARMQQVLGGGSALQASQSGWASFAEVGGGRNSHLQQLQGLLSGGSVAPSGLAGAFGSPASGARSPAPPAFLQSAPAAGAGQFSPLASPVPARPGRSVIQPTPNVLPFPTRDF